MPNPSGRTWWLLAATTAVIGVAAVSIAMSDGAGLGGEAPSGPVTEAQVAAQCLDTVRQLNGDALGEPVQRLVARDGDSQMRVYVAGNGERISTCRSGREGEEDVFSTVLEPGRPDRIRLFGGDDAVLKAHLLLGRLPEGAAGISARLTSGQVVTGTHDGDVFVIWTPGASMLGADLTATRKNGSVIDKATAPGA